MSGNILLHPTKYGMSLVLNHIRVSAASWHKGITAPTEDFFGIAPTLDFQNGRLDEVHYSLIVPYRMKAGSVIDVDIDWGFKVAHAGTVLWKLEYRTIAEDETIDGAVTEISKLTAGGHDVDELIRNRLDTGIVGAVAHDILLLHLSRDGVTDSLTSDACLIEVHFEYQRDSHGEPT